VTKWAGWFLATALSCAPTVDVHDVHDLCPPTEFGLAPNPDGERLAARVRAATAASVEYHRGHLIVTACDHAHARVRATLDAIRRDATRSAGR